MHALITGAGQIGTRLSSDLLAAGHTVTVLRRSAHEVPGTTTIAGDAGDRATVESAARGADVIFHCIHSTYDSRAWARDLPHREITVMDVAAAHSIPVVFPESVYAYGTGARDLSEDATPAPVAPLGRIRARLLDARRRHDARTLSVVAADLIGPTTAPGTAVFPSLVMGPAAKGRTAWILGDPDVERSFTYIPDMTAAMITAAEHADTLAPAGDTMLTVPAAPPLTQRQMAADAAAAAGRSSSRVRTIPRWVLRTAGIGMPMMRELAHQSYLWADRSVLLPGRLASEHGLTATPWPDVLDEWARDELGASMVAAQERSIR